MYCVSVNGFTVYVCEALDSAQAYARMFDEDYDVLIYEDETIQCEDPDSGDVAKFGD